MPYLRKSECKGFTKMLQFKEIKRMLKKKKTEKEQEIKEQRKGK